MFVVQIEGNIGSGKSTFIEYIKDNLEKFHPSSSGLNIKYIFEPISDWQNVNGINLLELYYENPKRFAELFQTNAFFTLLKSSLKINYEKIDLIIMERSLYSSIIFFCNLLLADNLITQEFYSIIMNAYQDFEDIIIHPNIVIYFQIDNSDITILKTNIQKRQRKGENIISIEYLKKLNNIYNQEIKKYKNVSTINIKMLKTKSDKIKTFNSLIDKILANIK